MATRVQTARAVRVDLCGGTVVDGRAGLVTGRVELLLAILVVRGPRGVRRDELLELLWPDDPPAARGGALDPLLSRLRRTVGPVEGRGLVRIAGPGALRSDLRDAAAAIAASRALVGRDPRRAQVLALEAAEVLAAPMLPAHDDPWSVEQRALQAVLATEALELVAEAGLIDGPPGLAPALRAAAALVLERPLHEPHVALLMRAQAAAGDDASALSTYDALRVRLSEELGASPGAALRERHRRLLAGADAADPPLALPAALRRERRRPLAGRATEITRLTAALARAEAPRLALVEGPSGTGKTRLVAEVAHERHIAGEVVLHGGCPRDARAPFAPVLEALRPLVLALDAETLRERLGPLAGDLAALVPALHRRLDLPPRTQAADDPLTRRHRLFEAVAALLAAVPTGRVLLVLDDLQWMDASSTLLLAHLLRAEELTGLAVLATTREEGGGPGAELSAAAHGTVHVRPGGLDLAAVREVVRAARPGAEPGLAERLLQRTRGNPLLLQASLETRSELGGGAELGRAVEAVLARAEAGTRAFVEVLAVDGGRAGLDVLAHALGVVPDDAADLADRANDAGLITPRPDRFAPGALHDSVRDAVLAALGRERCAVLHARLAGAYAAVHAADPGAVVVELARHWAGADGRAAALRAARYGEQAARRALDALAYEQAAAQARAAREQLEAPAGVAAQRLALLMLEGEAHNRGSALEQARVALGAALRLAQELGDDELVARIALEHGGHRLAAGILDEGLIGALEIGLAAALPGSVLHARLAGRLAAALFNGPVARRDELAAEAVTRARAAGDPEALAEALLWRHVGEVFRAEPAARAPLVDEAEALARAHGATALALHARMLRFSDLLEDGRLAAAREEIARWSAEADAARVPYHRWAAAVCAPTLALLDGDLGRARELLARAERLALPLGEDAVVVSAHSAHALAIGLWDGSAAAIAAAVGALVAGGAGVPVWESALALAEVLAGDPGTARDRVTRVVAEGLDGVVDANRLTTASFLALAGVAAGATAVPLERVHAVLAPHAGRWVVQHYGGAVHGPVDVRLALLETALGRPEEATASLARAAAALGPDPPLGLVLDRDHAAVRLLRAQGRDVEARALAARTMAAADAAGLAGWRVLLDAPASAARERRSAVARAGRPSSTRSPSP